MEKEEKRATDEKRSPRTKKYFEFHCDHNLYWLNRKKQLGVRDKMTRFRSFWAEDQEVQPMSLNDHFELYTRLYVEQERIIQKTAR